LRLIGVDAARDSLVRAADEWPTLRVTWERFEQGLDHEEIGDEQAQLLLRSGGSLVIDRLAGTARFATPRPLSSHELVHPFLAPAAAVMAHWYSRACVHSGAFVVAGRVWALAGGREAGKSSTLAWLALHGHPIVTDDVLVLDGAGAYAGPRAIDLRVAAQEHLGVGRPLGRIGARSRFRFELAPIESCLPFGGWVFLGWDDTPSLRRVEATALLPRLLAQRVLRIPPGTPEAWLELAALPAWELRRPRDWTRLSEALELLVAALVAGA
jgi:hypothetical protein